jgi:uncharacterized protein (TIGR00255 family)
MRSMTGFGIGEAPIGESHEGKLAVEIRGVNHRFLEVRVRLPRELTDLGAFLELLAREKLRRGRYEVAVRTEGAALGAPTLDRERARAVFRALCELRDELAPGREVPLAVLASVPDLFVASGEPEGERLHDAARRAFDAAFRSLDAMREREGNALGDDLRNRLETVRVLTRSVALRAPFVVEGYRRRLHDRIDRLGLSTEYEIDGVRLEQEIALFADRVDICEELTRLESHCDQFARLLEGTESCGRRLDFLLQEMAREANTVGAKSLDATTAHAVVEVKAEIERMREQVQNVE